MRLKKQHRGTTEIQVRVSRKWGLPSYGSIEISESRTVSLEGKDPREASSAQYAQLLSTVEARGRAYLDKLNQKEE